MGHSVSHKHVKHPIVKESVLKKKVAKQVVVTKKLASPRPEMVMQPEHLSSIEDAS